MDETNIDNQRENIMRENVKTDEYRKIIEQSGFLCFVIENKTNFPYRFIAGNLKQYGLTEEYIKQKTDSLLELFFSADVQRIDYSLAGLFKGSSIGLQIECRMKGVSTDYRWVELKGSFSGKREDSFTELTLFVSDITQKKLADASLKYKMSFTNSLIDAIPNPVYYKNTAGVFLGVNAAYERLINKSRNQIIGKKIEDLIPKENIGLHHNNEDEVIKSRKTQIFEDRILYGDNTWHDVLVSRSTFVNANMTVGGIIGVINDITELKKKEEELKESEVNYKSLASYLPEIVIVHSEEKVIFINEIVETKLGYKSEELIGNSVFNFIHPSYHIKVRDQIKKSESSWQTNDYNLELVKKDGGSLLFKVKAASIVFLGKKSRVVVLTDITEKERADERIRNSELQFRAIWEGSFTGMRLLDENGNIVLVNEAFCRIFRKRKEELEGHLFTVIYNEEDSKQKLDRFIGRLKNKSIEAQYKVKVKLWDGATIWLEVSNSIISIPGKPALVLSFFKDISKMVEIERQLSLSQKMESVGLLAAGIAHEINSPMQFIGDNNSFLKDSLNSLFAYYQKAEEILLSCQARKEEDERIRGLNEMKESMDINFLLEEIPTAIEQTQTGIERVNKIVRALKDFAHPSAKEKSLSDINNGIEVTSVISKNQWKYISDLELNLAPDLPYVNCLLDEINQVILNMIINAVHAIEEKLGPEPEEKGKIVIETKHYDGIAEIIISDSGMGIKPENLNKIYDPFFTTKEVGKGTGQGLSIVHDIIVNKHGGSLSVESEYGKGTTFKIKLPILEGAAG
jgi:PAS domain S-box-containing protein